MAGKEFRPQPFDGTQPEIPAEERRRAAQLFVTGIDSIFTMRPDETMFSFIYGGNVVEVLDLVTPTPTGTLEFSLQRLLDKKTDNYRNHLTTVIQHPGQSTKPVDPSHTYILDTDQVKRKDADYGKELAVDHELIEKARRGEVVAEISSLDYEGAEELEEAMGLNNQPVSAAEIESVIGLATEADIKPVSIQELFIQASNRAASKDTMFREIIEPEESAFAKSLFLEAIDEIFETHSDVLVHSLNEETGKDEATVLLRGENTNVVCAKPASTEDDPQEPYVSIFYRGSKIHHLFYSIDEVGVMSTQNELEGNTPSEPRVTELGLNDTKSLRQFLRNPVEEDDFPY